MEVHKQLILFDTWRYHSRLCFEAQYYVNY